MYRVEEPQMYAPTLTLYQLITRAVALGGDNLCVEGHGWQADGGRACPTRNDSCSQSVYRCVRCGDIDYGKGNLSLSLEECRKNCGDDLLGMIFLDGSPVYE